MLRNVSMFLKCVFTSFKEFWPEKINSFGKSTIYCYGCTATFNGEYFYPLYYSPFIF